MKCKSNAKINLGLKIKGIKDGYHLLESTFVPINIYDEIEITESDVDEIVGMDIDIEQNIIYKAICLVRKRYNIKKKYKVTINKEIPMQGGLGGGSSNAASVLKALNKINNLELDDCKLAILGLELGSDVPFFIYNKPSIVLGRGEIVKPIDDFKKIFGVLIFDDMYFSTKKVFDTFDNIEIKEELLNDLENAARALPNGEKIVDIENTLKELGAYVTSLTGSGGAIFGLFDSKEKAKKVERVLKTKYAFVRSFQSLI